MRTDERVLAVQSSLTGRDLRLMGWLYDHGVLTTPQIIAALFGSVSFAQRRLLRLLHLGVLARFRPLSPTVARSPTTGYSTSQAPKSSPHNAATPYPDPDWPEHAGCG